MTNGQSGAKPEWYDPLKAAVYFHISPDEAIRLPTFWIEAAEIALIAEKAVEDKRRQTEERNKGKQGNSGGYKGYGRKRRR